MSTLLLESSVGLPILDVLQVLVPFNRSLHARTTIDVAPMAIAELTPINKNISAILELFGDDGLSAWKTKVSEMILPTEDSA